MRILLTSPSLLNLFCSLGCASRPLLLLLLGSAPVEVLHHHSNEHVQHKEADEEEKRDEVNKTPFIVVLLWLLVQTNSVQAMVHYVDPTVL